MKKMIVSGGSGYLGNLIQDYFKNDYEIFVLSRSESQTKDNIHFIQWNAKTLGSWTEVLEHADVVINLAGKNINTRFTKKNKDELLSSRIDSTRILGKAIQECKNPPKIWLNASSAAIYEESYTEPRNEDSASRDTDFLSILSQQWEEAFHEYENEQTIKTVFRISMILGDSQGSALQTLKLLVKLGGGGAAGSGKQMVSWMGEEDFVRALDFIIKNQLSGVFNFCNNHALSNKLFMKKLREKYKVPFGIPVPEILIQIGTMLINSSPDLILRSQNIQPKNLLHHGFEFEQNKISDI